MRAKVTFEYPLRSPETVNWQSVSGVDPGTVASRALRAARAKIHPRCWSSIVVLLERDDVEQEVEAIEQEAESAE